MTKQNNLPIDLVLVRHGVSEANHMRRALSKEYDEELFKTLKSRHDTRHRLTPQGAAQSRQTGDYLKSVFTEGFDGYYVSPFNRALETAANLGVNGNWIIDDAVRERDWGIHDFTHRDINNKAAMLSEDLRREAYWYWQAPEGESLAADTALRVGVFLEKLRNSEHKSILIVSHGEFIGVARFIIEGLTPEEWMKQDADPAFAIKNNMIVHYTRKNPKTGELSDEFTWRKAICAWDENLSWNSGEWTEIIRKTYTDKELLEIAEQHDLLLED
jgi:broad specificity phosphatase PhoE